MSGSLTARPGQFVDVRNEQGDSARLAVIGVGDGILELESSAGDEAMRDWIDAGKSPGALLRVTGPYDAPR